MRSNSGFSLIEVVAAAGIIGFVMTGLVAIAQTTIRAQAINKNALIASMLAQEGLELVRKIRDENWRNGRDWKTGAGAGSQYDILQNAWSNSYTIDYLGTVNDASGINDSSARVFVKDGYYSHDPTGTATNFYRILNVVENLDSLDVSCQVRFARGGGGYYDYTAATTLYNWW